MGGKRCAVVCPGCQITRKGGESLVCQAKRAYGIKSRWTTSADLPLHSTYIGQLPSKRWHPGLSVEILLHTTFRFLDGKLLLRGRHLIERLLEQTSSLLRLFDTYCTTVSFIQIIHNPAYLAHGATTTKHLK